jgi:hypothetical protein
MNCANHPDIAAVAYCRTCGKPLCASCTRDVKGVIYCENCLAARLEGTPPPPPTVYQQVMDQDLGLKVPPSPGPGPNPTVAGILAGFFPFGVGAVYCGQYAKGLANLLIAFGLIWGQSTTESGGIHIFLGLAMGFFYFYQIIDAVRTARAVQTGQPVPDPFGLAKTFSPGERVDASKVPMGALILIGLGVLFLFHNLAGLDFGIDKILPALLILLGGWIFARRWGLVGAEERTFDCERCRYSGLMGPVILVTVGALWFVNSIRDVGFITWVGVLLIVIGGIKVLENSASTAGHIEAGSPPPAPGSTVVTGEVQPPSSEVHNG